MVILYLLAMLFGGWWDYWPEIHDTDEWLAPAVMFYLPPAWCGHEVSYCQYIVDLPYGTQEDDLPEWLTPLTPRDG